MKAANMPTGSVVATSDEVYIKRATLDIRPWESATGFSSNERIDALIACGDAEVLRVGPTRKVDRVVTSGGVELTPEREAALVAEAEAGYNPDQIRPRRRGRDAAVHNTTDLLPPGWRMHRPRWHPAGADPLDCRDCYPQGVSAEQAQQVIDAGGSVRRNDRYRATSRYFVDSLGDGDGTEPTPVHLLALAGRSWCGGYDVRATTDPDKASCSECLAARAQSEREVSENPGPIVREREAPYGDRYGADGE